MILLGIVIGAVVVIAALLMAVYILFIRGW